MSSKSVIALLVVLTTVPALAAAPDVVRARIEGLRQLGAAYKAVNDELKKGDPQPKVLQAAASRIRDAARNQYKWFPRGSGPQPGVKTRAKPEIWTRAAEFKAAQDNFARQANAFFGAAASGDVDKIRAQNKALGQACGACHRNFRNEDRS